MLPPNTTDNKSIAISIMPPERCTVYINATGVPTLLLDHLGNAIQDDFNHLIADHNFIVV
jgi:hypothetical protein